MTQTSRVPEEYALAALLHLGRRARQAADQAELRFILANETHTLAPYRQAALWIRGRGVVALSGVVPAEANAPYMQWLSRLFTHLDKAFPSGQSRVLCAADLREEDAAEWGQWFPTEGLWLALPAIGKRFAGGALLLARDVPWMPAERHLLDEWGAIWTHAQALHALTPLQRAWAALQPARHVAAPAETASAGVRRWVARPRVWIMATALLALLAPVNLSVLAPAEITPFEPALIRSPLDGVIDRIAVLPNQHISTGETLFEFDRTTINNRLIIAEQTLETVRTEYRQRAQQALSDEATKAQLAVLQGQVSEKTLEVRYLRELERRTTVTAPRDGIVLFDDPAEWIGKPVVTGERVMIVAHEGKVELEAWLSPADAIPLKTGARITLYLNADPLQPLEASLYYVAHEAVRRPDGQYAYRVRAHFQEQSPTARTGLKGTAKLEGHRVPALYWVLRRPLASARAWAGL